MDEERVRELEENSCNSYEFLVESLRLTPVQIHLLDYVIDSAIIHDCAAEKEKELGQNRVKIA